jgi:thiol-disulfide isomerase/thioredoxin
MGVIEIFDRDIEFKKNGLYIEKAKGTGGMVVVKTEWCSFCKKTMPILEETSRKLGSAYPIFKLDGDTSTKIKVDGYPTILFIDRNGRIKGKYTGERSVPGFLEGICNNSLVCKK